MDGGGWWVAVHGVAKSQTWLSDFPFTFHFHPLEEETATHSIVLAWRIPGMGEPGGLPSMGSHRVGHDWRDLAAAVVFSRFIHVVTYINSHLFILLSNIPLCCISVRLQKNQNELFGQPSMYTLIQMYVFLLGYCKQSCYEHLSTSFSVDVYFQFSWVNV